MQDLFSVVDKVAVVTGGSRGIGEMIATGFLANGARRVYISARKAQACDATAKRLTDAYKGECVSVPCDLSNTTGIEALHSTIGTREQHLDILVNNAGTVWGAPLEEFPESGWDKVMDLNVRTMFFLTRALVPLLRTAATHEHPARIINIGSIDGIRVPRAQNFSYSAAKAAVHHMTRVLAAELAPDDITVNAIAPGPFPSKMMDATLKQLGDEIAASNPRRRIGTPEDIAGVAIFLASRAGAYTTGAVIPCDGGISTATRTAEAAIAR